MQRLTKTQIEHFTTRVDKLLNKRASVEKAALGDRPVVPTYSFEEQLELIRRGKAKLKSNVSQHTYIHYCFEFPVSPAQARAKVALDRWAAKARIIDDQIAAEKTRIIDQAILGDSETALQALTTLELKLAKA